MEQEKLQRLHDALSKLAPKGKVGGLGAGAFSTSTKRRLDPTLPDNPLYRNFVRAGSGIGLYHKKNFDDSEEKPEKLFKDKMKSKKKMSDKHDAQFPATNVDVKIKKQKKRKFVQDEEEMVGVENEAVVDEVVCERNHQIGKKEKKRKTGEGDLALVAKEKKSEKAAKNVYNDEVNYSSSGNRGKVEKTSEMARKRLGGNDDHDVVVIMMSDAGEEPISTELKKKKRDRSEKAATIEDVGTEVPYVAITAEQKKKKKKKEKQGNAALCIEDVAVEVETACDGVKKEKKKKKKKGAED